MVVRKLESFTILKFLQSGDDVFYPIARETEETFVRTFEQDSENLLSLIINVLLKFQPLIKSFTSFIAEENTSCIFKI